MLQYTAKQTIDLYSALSRTTHLYGAQVRHVLTSQFKVKQCTKQTHLLHKNCKVL